MLSINNMFWSGQLTANIINQRLLCKTMAVSCWKYCKLYLITYLTYRYMVSTIEAVHRPCLCQLKSRQHTYINTSTFKGCIFCLNSSATLLISPLERPHKGTGCTIPLVYVWPVQYTAPQSHLIVLTSAMVQPAWVKTRDEALSTLTAFKCLLS